MGFCFAARWAGAIPKINPIEAATPNEMKIEDKDITVFMLAKWLTT